MYDIWQGGGFSDLLHHLVLPVITLSLVATGVIARLTRTAMLEVLRLDFIRTARAKGVSERQVIFRHAFRMALVSVIPAIGILLALSSAGLSTLKPSFSGRGWVRCWSRPSPHAIYSLSKAAC
jgi:peptide/nickel transport system permease protein